MSVLLETSLGDVVIDLLCDKAPFACKNFIKLCKVKYYNGALFYDVQKSYLTRVMHEKKDPTSLNHILYGDQAKYFEDQIDPERRHDKFGTVSTANVGPNMNNSNFFITLSDGNIESLNTKHTIFGLIAEGQEVLRKVNEAYVDEQNRPYKNIRILHTLVLEDPFDDPPNLEIPDLSPEINYDDTDRLDVNDDQIDLLEGHGRTEEEIIEETKKHEAKTKAIVLEMLNDLPDADIKPPDNILFVCKLNPLTEEDDLETIFSQFGPIKSCEIIRDWKTGASLQYAFIEFETQAACEEAFFKMENALIDERRIHVDFSQSVSKYWYKYKSGNPIAYGGGGKGDGPGGKHRNQPKLELKGRHREDKGGYGIVIDEDEANREVRRTKQPRENREPEPRRDKERHDKQREQREKERDREQERLPVKPREGSRERRGEKREDKRDDKREDKRHEKRDDRKHHHESRDTRDKGRRDRSKSRSRSPRRDKHESSRGRDKDRDRERKDDKRRDEKRRSRDRKDDRHHSRKEEHRKDDRRREKTEDKKEKKVSSSRSSSSSGSSSASSSRSSS